VNDERAALKALSDAVLEIAAEQRVRPVLRKLVDSARELVGARYAAIGVPDGEGGFAMFLWSGMTDAQVEAIGPLPRTHGMLDAVLAASESIRYADLQEDPRFEGWPVAHPDMHSMLGVPIVAKGTTIGAFYLTNKVGRPEFTEADKALIERFAAHAAVAIENAQLLERSRGLSVIEERNRLARDLHDSVQQTLFSLTLITEAATKLTDTDVARAKEQLAKIEQLARSALEEMRALVFELRPADLAADGLVSTLRKHIDVIRRTHDTVIDLDVVGERRLDEAAEIALFRIVQEALNNALKHAGPGRITVSMDMGDGLVRATVSDTGVGFEPEGTGVRTKHLGLTSMEERAQEVGADLRITSAPGRGTEVRVELPA
jgi:signal transduction histidine kinase